MAVCVAVALLGWGVAELPGQANRTQQTDPAGDVYPAKPRPLISLKSLDFLEGTWTAESTGADKLPMGSYSFVRELNGNILARRSSTDVNCTSAANQECPHRDLFYIFQESPGAPLKAIYFDSEGHHLRYDVEIGHEGGAQNLRETAVFLSETAAFGPRFRLSYERNQDTDTKAVSMSGRFERLLANGKWQTDSQWVGIPAGR